MIKFYNSLTHKTEEFKPIKSEEVSMYTCGPTVYWYAHLGNLRTYIFEDILKRVLQYNGYAVKHVMNITDVGHLTSDADSGEDKLEKGAQREGKTVWEIAEFYTNAFLRDIHALNILEPDILIKASETIREQIALIEELEKKGFTYQISDGIYFDTSKLPSYGALWPKKMELKAGARVEMSAGKKNESDFALWKFSPKNGPKRQMEWASPWGVGFPGWHTECVVMAATRLGIPFDIHCGGIDHVLIHHTNEIAQAQAAYGQVPANFWLHGEFMLIKAENEPVGDKMAKSSGNIILIEDVIKKNINPLSFRFLCLITHYRSKLNFSWDALSAANNALSSIFDKALEYKNEVKAGLSAEALEFQKMFKDAVNDDLDMPRAIAVMQEMLKSSVTNGEKYELLVDFDKILGLGIKDLKPKEIPPEIMDIAKNRKIARQNKDWQTSDRLRQDLLEKGWKIEDEEEGFKLKKS